MSGLKDKVVLITGASSGIGYDTARLFASRGALIAATGRNEANLEKLRYDCLADNPNASVFTIAGDLTKEEDVKRIVAKTIERFSRLDVLVNNAGTVIFSSIMDTSLEQFDNIMNINVRSVYRLSQLCVPHLAETKGNIVNVSSMASTRPFVLVSAYAISKAALDHMTRCLALELAPKHIRVNSINPGTISNTPIHTRCGMPEEEFKTLLERSKELYPVGRVGTTNDVAQAICFLADDSLAGFMNGNVILLDGGFNLTYANPA